MNGKTKDLLISTGSGCGVLCSYCPQVTLGREYNKRSRISRMSLEDFESCIEKLPLDCTLHFNGFYEPCLNHEFTAMIRSAHQRGFRVRVSTTLMGLSLSDIDEIKHIPFLKFAIHLPDNKGLTRIIVNDEYLQILSKIFDSQIANVKCHIHEEKGEPSEVHEGVVLLLEKLGVKPEDRWVNSRAGNLQTDEMVSRNERLTGELEECPRMGSGVLLPNGDVTLCCMDWSLQHVIGNLLEMKYEMLFESEEYNNVVRGYKDDKADILCRHCEIAKTKKDETRKSAIKELQSRYLESCSSS